QRQQAAWDDWESAYEGDNQPSRDVDKNVRLWQEANAAKPSYTILPSSSTSSFGRSAPPPSAALDSTTTNGPPKLMILKRPTATNPNENGRSASQEAKARGEKTLEEREKEYAEARRRIYGDEPVKQESNSLKNGKGPRGGNGKAKEASASSTPRSSSNGRPNSNQPSPRNSNRPSPAASRSSTPSGTSIIRTPRGPTAEGNGFGSKGGKGKDT
ncbi:hypothetical protein JCM5353_008308, partial [Sporobolomyces roseus]